MKDSRKAIDNSVCEKSSQLNRVSNTELLTFDRTAKSTHVRHGTPTEELSSELQTAYDFFNQALFNGELPHCMLTLDTRIRSAAGFFAPLNYIKSDGQVVDQINLNPEYTLIASPISVLSTIVHEQCHQWMHHFSGKPVTNGYHCKQWANKMESIGLIPSSTGKPGGAKTGYKMSDYPKRGGQFERCANRLLASGFEITWGQLTFDVFQNMVINRPDLANKLKHLFDLKFKHQQRKKKSKGKQKFICPQCQQACWGKQSLTVICGNDQQRMLPDTTEPNTQSLTTTSTPR